ncbi:MAG: hypothetical protein CAPSK01_000653 [Candidatus Accumulibacter vicinus]|uniref:Uncharacterized protein n=2 Tax=Candidatus Accumulibacter vicinus TaxID=2954382 RepID=A0A084Y4F0_9PROT|nr:MAG: hypothetical protein CAPSK01_000653 [Candidatus Accumulibacter vicinus]
MRARDTYLAYRRDDGESHTGGALLAAEIARLLLVGDTNSASVRHGFLVLIPLDMVREARTVQVMRTVIETPTFQKQAAKLWSEDERLDFIDWIAANPLAGDVIPGADSAREVVLLVAAYGKAERSNMLPVEIDKVV